MPTRDELRQRREAAEQRFQERMEEHRAKHTRASAAERNKAKHELLLARAAEASKR